AADVSDLAFLPIVRLPIDVVGAGRQAERLAGWTLGRHLIVAVPVWLRKFPDQVHKLFRLIAVPLGEVRTRLGELHLNGVQDPIPGVRQECIDYFELTAPKPRTVTV